MKNRTDQSSRKRDTKSRNEDQHAAPKRFERRRGKWVFTESKVSGGRTRNGLIGKPERAPGEDAEAAGEGEVPAAAGGGRRRRGPEASRSRSRAAEGSQGRHLPLHPRSFSSRTRFDRGGLPRDELFAVSTDGSGAGRGEIGADVPWCHFRSF